MSPTCTRKFFNNPIAPRSSPTTRFRRSARTSPLRPLRTNKSILQALTSYTRGATLNQHQPLPLTLLPTLTLCNPTFMMRVHGVFLLLSFHLPPYSTQIQHPPNGTFCVLTLNPGKLPAL